MAGEFGTRVSMPKNAQSSDLLIWSMQWTQDES
jgi:hypothetical protein